VEKKRLHQHTAPPVEQEETNDQQRTRAREHGLAPAVGWPAGTVRRVGLKLPCPIQGRVDRLSGSCHIDHLPHFGQDPWERPQLLRAAEVGIRPAGAHPRT
jgi:hypothetical protein